MHKNSEEKEVLIMDLQDNLVHGLCVSNLTYRLATELGYEESFCRELATAGLVHDIGKLQLSDYLYGRRDELADTKLSYTRKNKNSAQYMRMHSKLSYDILKKYGYDETVLQTVLHHHENYDGSGYPDSLKGEDIPLGARIMRVADTFTALTSERPYRHAFDVDTAMEIMIDEIEFYDMRVFLCLQRLVHEESTFELIRKSKEPIEVSRKIFSRDFLGLIPV